MAATTRVDGYGIEVIVEELDNPERPHCPHGPTIVFERFSNGKIRRYFACSSNRDRKQCNFYQADGDKVSEATEKAREMEIKAYKDKAKMYTYSRMEKAQEKPEERRFCRRCHLFFVADEEDEHKEHPCFDDITDEQLSQPTHLLAPLQNNKSNAQYLFAEKTVKFFKSMLDDLGFTHVLCVGTPSLHEVLDKQKSFLLDIDFRLRQFYPASSYSHYNMFNHYFFDGEKAREGYEAFLSEASQGKVAIIIDPPFGGLVGLIDHTLKLLTKDLIKSSGKPETDIQSPSIFWIFPYFLEPRVCDKRPDIHMLDYKVDYMNHEAFHDGPKGRKLGSPVRIFTNHEMKEIVLPKDEGYRYCERCERYVAKENEHCRACKCCPSKDGSTYVHCEMCEKCMKPARVHCNTCNACLPQAHKCGEKKGAGCYICGDFTHKRTDCPQKKAARKGKRIHRHDGSTESTFPKKMKSNLSEKGHCEKMEIPEAELAETELAEAELATELPETELPEAELPVTELPETTERLI